MAIFTTRKQSRGKVMFSQVSVSHSAHMGQYVSSDDHQVSLAGGGGYVSSDDQ